MNRFIMPGFPLLPRWVAGWIFAVLAGVAAAQPAEIRIGVVGPPTQPLNLLFSQKFYQEAVLAGYGKTYRVTLNRVASTPVAAQLFAAGQIEIAMLAAPAISNMIEQGVAKKEELAIVGAGITDGYGKHISTYWAALNTSNIRSVADLRGKIIALNGFGTNSDAALRTMLLKHGLDPAKDVQIVELAFPNMEAALNQKRVDVAQFTVPFSARVRAAGTTRVLFSFADALGGPSYSTVAVVKKAAAQKIRPALEDFFKDFVAGLKWLGNPANREQAIKIAASGAGTPEAILRNYYLTDLDQGQDENLCVRADWLQHPLNLLVETKILKSAADLRPLIDYSYLPRGGAACR